MIALGERNREIIELVRLHCSNAAVEKPPFGGHGMLEAETGLPIDMRTVRCEYAAHAGAAGMQLESIALDFWENNCGDCPHRDPRGLPNLATLGGERLAQREEQAKRAKRVRSSREVERAKRVQERRARVAGEPAATRAFVALLEGVDAEQPDDRAGSLLDEARATPERCTPAAAEILVSAVEHTSDDRLLEALDHLERAGYVNADALLAAAIRTLSRRPSEAAARLVVRLQSGLSAGDLTSAIAGLVWLAGRSNEPFDRAAPYIDGLELAAGVDLPAVLDELIAGIEDPEPERRGRWAYAASELMDRLPETAAPLAKALTRALEFPDSLSPYAGSPSDGVNAGLHAALRADPQTVAALYDGLAGALDVERRQALFRAYTDALRGSRHDGDAPSGDLLQVALDGVFGRLGADWGRPELVDDAVQTLELVARYQPELIADRVDVLFGALLQSVVPEPDPSASGLLRPPSPLDAMKEASDEMVRRARIGRLREIVGLLAPLRPQETLVGIEAVLGQFTLPEGDAAKEIRGHAVRLLGDVGSSPELAAQVLPKVIGYALGPDIIERTLAIEALSELARTPHRRLPNDVLELIAVWLVDPYRGPHRAAVEALSRGFPVTDSVLQPVVGALTMLSRVYSSQDPHFLDGILRQLWRLSLRLDDDLRFRIQRWCLELAEHLTIRDLEDFVRWPTAQKRDPLNDDVLVKRLLQVLSNQQDANVSNGEGPVIRLLASVSAATLTDSVPAILDAAREQLPGRVRAATRFVEVLQCADRWDAADDLAQEIVQSIPDTVERRGSRARARAVAAATRLERALTEDSRDRAFDALKDWEAALVELRQIEADQKMPWQELPR